jgi:hypothetical protein
VKPAPAIDAPLIVTAVLPVDVKVAEDVAAVFTITSPNDMLVVLVLSVDTAAFNCRTKWSETLAALAVSVTVCVDPTGDTVAVNPALVALAGTITVAGTVTAALLLDRLTFIPFFGAAARSVTVQASVPEPVMDALLQ